MNGMNNWSGFGIAELKRLPLIVLTAASLAGFAVQPAAGQQPGARNLEEVLPAEQAARVREIAREAREAGVPPGLIARKAFEGAAKGICGAAARGFGSPWVAEEAEQRRGGG